MKRETGANPVRTRHCDKGVAANKSLILIGKAAVNDDLSARRPALGEVITATSNWSGMDETGLTMSIITSMPSWRWRFFIMANVIMVQGTMSNAGKSLLVAGLCRISSCAAAAILGIALGENKEEIHIIPGPYDIGHMLQLKEIKIYMKSVKNLAPSASGWETWMWKADT